MKKNIFVILFLCGFLFCYGQKSDPFIEGMVYMQQHKLDIAEKSFDTAIEMSLKLEKSYLNMGIVRYWQGNFSEAADDFQKATELGNMDALFWNSKLYATQQIADKAVNYLEKYLETVEVSNPYKLFKDECFAKIYSSNEWQDFINNFEPNEIQLAVINSELFISKQDYNSAHHCLDLVLSKNPESDKPHEAKSIVYEKEGNLTLARFEMKKALDINPLNVNYIVKIADLELMMQNFEASNIYYKNAKEISPENFSLYLSIARTSLKNGNANDAKSNVSEYLNYFPDDTSALFLRARADFDLQSYTDVLKTVNRLMENNRPHADWFLLRGMTYYKNSTYKYAASDLSMCLDLDPKNLDANYYLGLSEYEKDNKQLACYYWQRALRFGDSRAFDKVAENCGAK
jgi:tetratricopeptide (TPR) repeat protein